MFPKFKVLWKSKKEELTDFQWFDLRFHGTPDMAGEKIRFQGLRKGRHVIYGETFKSDFEILEIYYED